MATFGLTSTGFVIRTLENINDLVLQLISSAIGVTPSDGLLKVLQIYNERLAEIWQLAQAIYSAGDVDAATGAGQDNLNAITGTVREAAVASTVTLTWTGNGGITVPAESVGKQAVSLQRFSTLASAVTVTLSARTDATVYVAGDRRTSASRVYVVTVGGTSGTGTPPTTTAVAITDGGVTWRYVGDGTAAVDTAAACTVTGPVIAVTGTVTVLGSSISGIVGINNLSDAIVGQDVETDPDYRVRRELELAQAGSGTALAIRAALSAAGGTNVTVFTNSTDAVNVDSMPPHSVEALVTGLTATQIGTLLMANVDAGIATTGTSSVFITDAQGFVNQVFYSRPQSILISNTIVLTYDPKMFPSDGVAQGQAAIVAYGQAQPTGMDARPYQVGKVVGSVSGVLDITSNLIAVFPTVPVAATNIVLSSRQLAVYDTTRISITANPGTP